MKFASRLHPHDQATFRQALFSGIAPGGGLYHPVDHPDLSALIAAFDESVTFNDVAAIVSAALLAPEIDEAAARRIAGRAFSFAPPPGAHRWRPSAPRTLPWPHLRL